jgi:acyl-coenzyme A thioesterase PaaI-like protein
LEGYVTVVHGGVVCAVLDGAMTNCLFAAGKSAVTGDLRVRFRKPISTRSTAKVRAWIEESLPPLHRVAAHVEQDGEIKATAIARFMDIPSEP